MDYNERECGYEDCAEFFEPVVHNQRYCSAECKRGQRLVRDRKEQLAEFEEVAEDPERVEYLRREVRRLERLYLKHKHARDEREQATYRAAKEALEDLKAPRTKPPRLPQAGKGDPEICNPVLADFQLGKVTPSYNSEICKDRIERFAEKIIDITNVQRADHPVNKCHVHILGDIVEGETIFPGQQHEIDSSIYKQVINAVNILSDFIQSMLDNFEQVHVSAVIGNHGKLDYRGNFSPETNMDRMAYKWVQTLFANEPRVTWDIPDGDNGFWAGKNYYTVDVMGDYSVLLVHGDQVSKPSTTPSYFKKILGWKTSGIPEDFDDVIMGHWHQNSKLTIGKTVVRVVGSPESDNLYAQERLGVMGRPSQHLQFVSPKRGAVTAEYDVYLD